MGWYIICINHLGNEENGQTSRVKITVETNYTFYI